MHRKKRKIQTKNNNNSQGKQEEFVNRDIPVIMDIPYFRGIPLIRDIPFLRDNPFLRGIPYFRGIPFRQIFPTKRRQCGWVLKKNCQIQDFQANVYHNSPPWEVHLNKPPTFHVWEVCFKWNIPNKYIYFKRSYFKNWEN